MSENKLTVEQEQVLARIRPRDAFAYFSGSYGNHHAHACIYQTTGQTESGEGGLGFQVVAIGGSQFFLDFDEAIKCYRGALIA